MAMDVYGIDPKNSFGKIFRRNIWIWHPMWGYIESEYKDIASRVRYAHSNDGDGLDNQSAIILSHLINSDLCNGKIISFVESQHNNIDDEYRKKFEVDYHDFRDFKDFLLNCGGFKIC
jgi:hypothetical protein